MNEFCLQHLRLRNYYSCHWNLMKNVCLGIMLLLFQISARYGNPSNLHLTGQWRLNTGKSTWVLGECKERAKRKGVYGHSNCNCRAHHEEDSFSLSSTVSRSSLVTVNDRSQRCDITWNLTKRQWTLCHPGELICIAKRYTNYCSQRTMVAAPLSDQGNERAVVKRNNFGTHSKPV